MLTRLLLAVYLWHLPSGVILSNRRTKWNGLKVTWSTNFRAPNAFASLPRTERYAIQQGFVKISDCNAKAAFRGTRYVKDGDFAVVLLYDVNGYIAGIQAGLPKGLPSNYPFAEIQPPFVEDENRYFVTTYFVNPAIICTSGPTSYTYTLDGTGTDLFIQNGTDPIHDVLRIPNEEMDIRSTAWTEGHCVRTMGVHYWYNISRDMSCHDFFPVFLLYNSGELTAFGWAFGADLQSPRYEHPPPNLFGLFLNPVPHCLSTMGPLSTMHIYLTSHPELDLC